MFPMMCPGFQWAQKFLWLYPLSMTMDTNRIWGNIQTLSILLRRLFQFSRLATHHNLLVIPPVWAV
jgi:hypothetical protein